MEKQGKQGSNGRWACKIRVMACILDWKCAAKRDGVAHTYWHEGCINARVGAEERRIEASWAVGTEDGTRRN